MVLCVAAALVAMLLGVLAGWVLRGRVAAEAADGAVRAQETLARAADAAAAQEAQLRAELERERLRAARLETAAERDAAATAEKLRELTALRADMDAKLAAVAAEALRGSQESFLQLAGQVLDRHRTVAASDLEGRQKAIEGLLTPVAKTLEEYRQGLARFETDRTAQYASLQTEVQSLARAQAEVRQETGRLVNALRAAPKTRGRWGEQQLRTVLELSGMTQHVDFAPEQTFGRDGAAYRPDVVIRMPGDRYLVVDAKTSLQAYLDACDASDDAAREDCLRRHAGHLRTHMQGLSRKEYWDSLTVTPDFVAMFVPGDAFFIAAMERDPTLFEDAVAGRVLIVTPTTLIGLAKAVAYGWRQERLAENAAHVARLGQDLYKRLSTLGSHVAKVGGNLSSAVGAYNALVGSLEQSVMPQARRFTELDVPATSDPLPALPVVELEPRSLKAGRDLRLVEEPAPVLGGG